MNNSDATQQRMVAKAVLTPAVLTMVADGRIDPAELAQLGKVCSLTPIFADFSAEELMAMIGDILIECSDHGGPSLAQAAARSLSPALRETAMCFAMRVALADGGLAESEKETIAGMASLLLVAPESLAKIFDVTVMMQRPAVA